MITSTTMMTMLVPMAVTTIMIFLKVESEFNDHDDDHDDDHDGDLDDDHDNDDNDKLSLSIIIDNDVFEGCFCSGESQHILGIGSLPTGG